MGSRYLLLITALVAFSADATVTSQEPRGSLCGRVVAVSCTGPSSQVTLQLALPWGGPTKRLVIPANLRPQFGPRIEDLYELRSVCVSSDLVAANNGPLQIKGLGQIVTTDPPLPAHLPNEISRTCDPDVTLPTRVKDVKPFFTADAMRAKVNGSVFLQGIVDRNGVVGAVVIVQSLEPSLDVSAREAFEQWQFRPATRAGEPVPMVVSVQMAFTAR